MPIVRMRCGDARVMSTPSKRIVPLAGGSRPEMALRVDDLPAPLAPMTVTSSPLRTFSETPLMASTLP